MQFLNLIQISYISKWPSSVLLLVLLFVFSFWSSNFKVYNTICIPHLHIQKKEMESTKWRMVKSPKWRANHSEKIKGKRGHMLDECSVDSAMYQSELTNLFAPARAPTQMCSAAAVEWMRRLRPRWVVASGRALEQQAAEVQFSPNHGQLLLPMVREEGLRVRERG
jgi:hypothetical protein